MVSNSFKVLTKKLNSTNLVDISFPDSICIFLAFYVAFDLNMKIQEGRKNVHGRTFICRGCGLQDVKHYATKKLGESRGILRCETN